MNETAGPILDAISSLMARGERAALATVVSVSGSVPQRVSARMLLLEDGSSLGTVGGGTVEHAVTAELRIALQNGEPRLLDYDLARDFAMCCGGRMQIFIEVLASPQRLFLLGAGHVARATAPLARSVGFQVVVVDEREELNTPQRFPDCGLELHDPADFIDRHALGERDWLLIVTHDHHLDQQTLERALEKRPRYVGLVGSRRKVFRFLRRIAARKGDLVLDRLYAPVGLDIGAVGPEEIAISVVAELIALRRGAPAAHLRAVDATRLQALLASEAAELP